MSQNPERENFADVLLDAAGVFEPPDAASLHGAAVRRGRQIRRRRAGAAVAGAAVALSTAGVLAFALPGAPNHAAAVVTAAAPKSAASPSSALPTVPPEIRSGQITGNVMEDAIEYALPPGAQLVMPEGGFGPANIEVIDVYTHSWYVQGAVSIKSNGPIGTTVAVAVDHTGDSETCSSLNHGLGGGKGTCTQSTLDGGKLLDEVIPKGILSSDEVTEELEWYSPAGYQTEVQLGDDTTHDFALTRAQIDAILTNRVFGQMAGVLPPDACVGGSFSKPVDPPKPGQSPLQHVRCKSDGKLFPTY